MVASFLRKEALRCTSDRVNVDDVVHFQKGPFGPAENLLAAKESVTNTVHLKLDQVFNDETLSPKSREPRCTTSSTFTPFRVMFQEDDVIHDCQTSHIQKISLYHTPTDSGSDDRSRPHVVQTPEELEGRQKVSWLVVTADQAAYKRTTFYN